MPLHALLSPLHQSIVELKKIIESDQLSEYLPSCENILKIELIESDYLISTQNYTMLVEVIEEPQTSLGPKNFKMIYNEPIKNIP